MAVISLMLAAVLAASALALSPTTITPPENISLSFPGVCGPACQAAYAQGLPYDSSVWVHPNVSEDPFYGTPKDFSDYSVGDMIKFEDVSTEDSTGLWWVPSGLSLSRFFYVSQDIDDKPLPATGYVLMPYRNPLGSNETFRVVVWAHGTAGFTPQCAPSNNRGLQYNWMAPFILAQQGYVVIAPDYAGQGSQIPQGFMYNAGIPHAADVSLAIKAARQEFGDLMKHEWVVVGHSEGGLTAWRTAQREADPKKAVGGLIGAVAIAPAVEVMNLVPWVIEKAHGGPLKEIFLPFMLRSISRLLPSFDLTKYLTDKLIKLTKISTDACLNVAIPLLGNLTLNEMYLNNANFTSAPEVQEWNEKYQGKGAYELGSPMLVLHGEEDFIIPHEHIESVFDEQCETFPNSTAQYMLLPGLDHDGSVTGSPSVYFPWIADRFSKKELKAGCTKGEVVTATDRFSTVEQTWLSGGEVLTE
ncbi:Alpha/Beta hydrolase protein [Aspergillus aurantiobrunneus]